MTNYDVVSKLIGPVDPVGDSSVDNQRYQNLQDLIHLTDKLLQDIRNVAGNKDMMAYSMKKAGERADEFLKYNEIPSEEFEKLKEDQKLLRALRGAGVDNWEGYDIAIDMMED